MQTQVNLGEMNITDSEIEEIAREIKKARPNVQSIFLNDNNISDKGAAILGKEFTSLKNLTFLDLQFNSIDKKGAAAILSLASSHPGLDIALHGNRITNTGEMKKIEDAVVRRPKV